MTADPVSPPSSEPPASSERASAEPPASPGPVTSSGSAESSGPDGPPARSTPAESTGPLRSGGLLGPVGRWRAKRVDRLVALAAAADDERGESLTREALRRLRHSPAALVGGAVVLAFVVLALVGPLLTPPPSWLPLPLYSPTEGIGLHLVRPGRIPGASADHWFGLDHLGRDELSRMIYGARQTLLVGVVATLVGFTVGALIGGVAGAANAFGGRLGRWLDTVLMRFIDLLLALPSLLLAFSVAAVLGRSLLAVMIAVGVASTPIFARLLRGSMIAQAHRDHVLAATALGVRRHRVVLGHVLPNSLAPVIVQATLTLATAIIEAAGLSFLGLGNPDSRVPEWGTMLAQAQDQLSVRPMLAVYPAAAIIITALGFTLLGEAMREALDPKLRR